MIGVRSASAQSRERSTSPLFTVTSEVGGIREISSPDNYRTANAHFLDNSTTPLQLTNTRFYVITGHIGPDGQYRYPFKVQADPGLKVGGIELAINPSDHTELMAVGIPTAASSTALDQRFGKTSEPVQASVPSPSTSTSTAPLHLIWKDPINVWVAEVMTDLRWSWNGSQVSNCAWQDRYEHWVLQTGWNRYTGPYYYGPDYNYVPPTYTANWCKVNTAVSFVNLAFCDPTQFTYISVYQNIAYGYYNGTRSASIDTAAAGDCSGLLSHFWQWG